jgi:hypothetical protein
MGLHDRLLKLLEDAHAALDEVADKFDHDDGSQVQAAHDALSGAEAAVGGLKPNPEPEAVDDAGEKVDAEAAAVVQGGPQGGGPYHDGLHDPGDPLGPAVVDRDGSPVSDQVSQVSPHLSDPEPEAAPAADVLASSDDSQRGAFAAPTDPPAADKSE